MAFNLLRIFLIFSIFAVLQASDLLRKCQKYGGRLVIEPKFLSFGRQPKLDIDFLLKNGQKCHCVEVIDPEDYDRGFFGILIKSIILAENPALMVRHMDFEIPENYKTGFKQNKTGLEWIFPKLGNIYGTEKVIFGSTWHLLSRAYRSHVRDFILSHYSVSNPKNGANFELKIVSIHSSFDQIDWSKPVISLGREEIRKIIIEIAKTN